MIISQTPLRISFLGGGTDLLEYSSKFGGRVLSTTIDKFIYVLITKRCDDKIVIGYSKQETVDSIDEIQHDLIREAAKMTGLTKGFEVKTMADVPSTGSGLGSSSTLTVGLLNAFFAFQGIQVTAEQLAQQACHIEIKILKNPIGLQDQYAAAFGGFNIFEFYKEYFLLTPQTNWIIEENFLLFNTGITRSASTILKEQNKFLEENIELYHQLKRLTYEQKNIDELITKDWEIKKQLSPSISNDKIEKMIDTVRYNGASGWKLLGAGGGGHLLVYCYKQYQDRLRKAMQDYKELPFHFEPFGSKIIFNYRR